MRKSAFEWREGKNGLGLVRRTHKSRISEKEHRANPKISNEKRKGQKCKVKTERKRGELTGLNNEWKRAG